MGGVWSVKDGRGAILAGIWANYRVRKDADELMRGILGRGLLDMAVPFNEPLRCDLGVGCGRLAVGKGDLVFRLRAARRELLRPETIPHSVYRRAFRTDAWETTITLDDLSPQARTLDERRRRRDASHLLLWTIAAIERARKRGQRPKFVVWS